MDVSQEVIVRDHDCEFAEPFYVQPRPNDFDRSTLFERIIGRIAGDVIADPQSGEIIIDRNEMIDEVIADQIKDAASTDPGTVSPHLPDPAWHLPDVLWPPARHRATLVEIGQAVGVIAAQSIGEPGTQLTMRTFHTGGSRRVRHHDGSAPGAGTVRSSSAQGRRRADPHRWHRIHRRRRQRFSPHPRHLRRRGAARLCPARRRHPPGTSPGEPIAEGNLLAVVVNPDAPDAGDGSGNALVGANIVQEIRSDYQGEVEISADGVTVVWREEESRSYDISSQMTLRVNDGQMVMAGDALVDGPLDLRELLDIRGLEGLQHYLVDEVQEVYRSQGVSIHDKHIEVILRQMLRRVQVETAGDTEFIPGDVVDKFRFQDQNNRVLAEGGEPATAKTLLLGVSKAALTTDSFLSKASFQETTKVLTMAAVASDRDWLRGLKENVIIGRLIPARLESLLASEETLALMETFEEYDDDVLAPAWLSGEGEFPGELDPVRRAAALDMPQEVIDEELISGQPAPAFASGSGSGLDDAGYQIRTADEEDELIRRAQSLTESDSEVDREVEATASRIFSPFEDEDEDVPSL